MSIRAKSQRGHEPYDGRTLVKWLHAECRPTLLPHSDHVYSAYELPNGRTVVIPGPSAEKRPVSTSVARKIAEVLGKTYEELRADLGFPLIKHSRPKAKAIQAKPSGCSKSDVIGLVNEMRHLLVDVEQAVKPGQRDSAFYARVRARLVDARTELSRAAAAATQIGAQQ